MHTSTHVHSSVSPSASRSVGASVGHPSAWSSLLRKWGVTLAMGAGLVTLGTLYTSADALPQAAQSQVPGSSGAVRVGVVDMMALINGLTELKDRNDAMRAVREEMRSDVEKLSEQAKALEAELKDTIPRDQVQLRIDKTTQLQELGQLIKIRGERFEKMIDLRNAAIVRELYAKAQAAIDAYAQREGLDLVLLDDRPVVLTEIAGTRQLQEEVLMKRVLYAGPKVDITQGVLAVMENEYTQGKK